VRDWPDHATAEKAGSAGNGGGNRGQPGASSFSNDFIMNLITILQFISSTSNHKRSHGPTRISPNKWPSRQGGREGVGQEGRKGEDRS